MNQDEIIRMAQEAGILETEYYDNEGEVKAFAALVAAAEREACAKVCEDYGRSEEMQAIGNDYADAIRARGETK